MQLPNRSLLLAVCAAGIGGTFQYGYNVSVINAPTQVITCLSLDLLVLNMHAHFLFLCTFFHFYFTCWICILSFVFYLQYVQNFINETWRERYQTDISTNALTLLWSSIVSVFTIGGLLGVTVGGTLSVKLGRYGREKIFWHILAKWSYFSYYISLVKLLHCFSRKGTLLANNGFALAAALLMGLSYPSKVFELLVIGRFIIGMNAGK